MRMEMNLSWLIFYVEDGLVLPAEDQFKWLIWSSTLWRRIIHGGGGGGEFEARPS